MKSAMTEPGLLAPRNVRVRRRLKASLAAGGIAAMMLLSGCGDDEEQAQSGDAANAVAEVEKAAIDPALAPGIQKGIEDYLVLMEGPAPQRVMHHQAVKVTPGAKAFDVAIEGIRFGAQGEEHLDIGTVTYRLTPTEAGNYVASDLVHAETFPFKNKDGKETGRLAMKTKSFTGEWVSALESFTTLNWQATDIVAMEEGAGAGDMRAASLTASLTSTDKGNGRFDQLGEFSLSGFTAKDTAGGIFAFEGMAGKVAMSGIVLKEYVAKSREMQTLMAEVAEANAKAAEAAASANTADGSAPPSAATMTPEQAQKLSGLIKGMSGLVSGVTYDFDFTNMSFKGADGSETFGLKEGNFDLGFAGLDAEKATLSFGIGHDGLAMKDLASIVPPQTEKLLPAKGSFAVTLSDVPSKELWALLGDRFPGLLAADESQAEAAINVMFLAVGELLQKSPMKLIVAPSGLDSEAMQVDASGAFDVRPEAAVGLIGALDVDVHGLDDAMKLATEAAQTSPEAAQLVGAFAMIQSLAKRENSADGKPVDKLKIEVDAMGDTKVNGVSLSGM